MKRLRILSIPCLIFLILFLHFSSTSSLAAEANNGWRPVYDTVLMWINFGIILFLTIKFGKAPLLNFLESCTNDIASEIDLLEKEKIKTVADIDETNEKIEKSNLRLAEIKEKIIANGEKTKLEILKDAENQSMLMLKAAHQKSNNYIAQAKNTFRSELIDTAFGMAMAKLPGQITKRDNENILKNYISNISEKV